MGKISKRRLILSDIDSIPLDDEQTYEVFKNGTTKGIFQFSSEGMRAHLKQLKPDKFDDLIAMNALYRPGPMDNIDDFIARKHGKKKIDFLGCSKKKNTHIEKKGN